MDIRGIGDALAGELVQSGKVKDVADLYYLTQDDLLSLGLTPRKAANLLRSIEQSKDRSPARLIFGIGIADIGLGMATTLARHSSSLDQLEEASIEALLSVPGIGKKTAEAIRRFFENEANRQMLAKLRSAGVGSRGNTR
jgi:DNA ligase (NAD+)